MVAQAGLSRMYGGIHDGFDVAAGQLLGAAVAQLAIGIDRSVGLLSRVRWTDSTTLRVGMLTQLHHARVVEAERAREDGVRVSAETCPRLTCDASVANGTRASDGSARGDGTARRGRRSSIRAGDAFRFIAVTTR
jgi:hypothetical protein